MADGRRRKTEEELLAEIEEKEKKEVDLLLELFITRLVMEAKKESIEANKAKLEEKKKTLEEIDAEGTALELEHKAECGDAKCKKNAGDQKD